jgi:hypothetical protein
LDTFLLCVTAAPQHLKLALLPAHSGQRHLLVAVLR